MIKVTILNLHTCLLLKQYVRKLYNCIDTYIWWAICNMFPTNYNYFISNSISGYSNIKIYTPKVSKI